MVYKKITLVGKSEDNFEGAVEDAIGRADATLDDLQWATVVDQSVKLAGGDREYRAEVEVAFDLHEEHVD